MRDSILISIHPEYVDKILSGEKRFEFRKKVPATGLKRMVIYSTSPVMKVVAVAEVEATISESPDRVWRKTRQASGITKEFFQEYFGTREIAHALVIGRVKRLKNPISLKSLCSSLVAPQSYRFIDETLLRKL